MWISYSLENKLFVLQKFRLSSHISFFKIKKFPNSRAHKNKKYGVIVVITRQMINFDWFRFNSC